MTTYLIDKAEAERGGQPGRGMKASTETRSQPERRRKGLVSNVDQVLEDSFPASDPPSWTGSISRVANAPKREQRDERIVHRIRAEFLEMPGLCLTIEQAQRLWCLEPRTCDSLLRSLTDSRYLRRTDRGLFVLRRPPG